MAGWSSETSPASTSCITCAAMIGFVPLAMPNWLSGCMSWTPSAVPEAPLHVPVGGHHGGCDPPSGGHVGQSRLELRCHSFWDGVVAEICEGLGREGIVASTDGETDGRP